MVEGTIKGGRSASQITNKTESDRLILFGEYLKKSSDGNYNVQYAEYHFSNDQLVKDGAGEVTLPASCGPATVAGTWRMHAAFQLRSMDYSGAIPGTDGYEQYIWLVYPDKNRHYHGVMFKSDTWINDPDWVESGDLDQDSTYPGVKDCWSLLGIIDGPPPVSMNWAKWDSTWGFPVPATTLEFESDTSGATEFVTQTEHEWSIGESVEIKKSSKRMKASLSEKFKYSSTWENTVANSQTWSSTYTLPIEMEEESQDYGYYIYSVPQLRRFSYALFPWWDDITKQEYPNMNSFQYLFLTIANTIVPYPVLLSSYPFHVNEPNARNMKEWSEYEGRYAMHKEAADNGLFPVLHLDWTNFSNGSTMSVQTSIESKTSDSQTNSWDFEVEAGGGLRVPKVCRIETQLSTGYSGSLMNETTTTSEYGRRITASLKPLHFTSQGVNLSSLHMNLYLFSPETNANWSYFDSLNGQKPFYLAWEVTSASESLALESPADGDQLGEEDLLFSWQSEGGELHDYVLVISSSPPIADVNTIYRKPMGTSTDLVAGDFHPGPGMTYYWAVKGYNAAGDLVYSPVRSFTMKKTGQVSPFPEMRTVICSSPGTLSDLRIVVNPVKDGPVVVTLTDLSGQAVARSVAAGRAGITLPFNFAGGSLAPGIYLAVISSGDEQVVRKVIIR